VGWNSELTGQAVFSKWKQARAKASEQVNARHQLKARVESLLDLCAGDSVSGNEIACADPGCPEIETVILLMRPGDKTRAIKIPGPMGNVSDSDLFRALNEKRIAVGEQHSVSI
jgi:hypothetical protein